MILTILLALGAPIPMPATAKAECVFDVGDTARVVAFVQWVGSPDFAAKAGLRGAKVGVALNGTTVRLEIFGAREGTALESAAAAVKLVTGEPGKVEMASLIAAYDQARADGDDRFEGRRIMKCGLGRMRQPITDPSQMPAAWQIRMNRPTLLTAPRLTVR